MSGDNNLMVTVDYSKTQPFIEEHNILDYTEEVEKAHFMLHDQTGSGSEFLGWVDLPVNYDRMELDRIKKIAGEIKSKAEVLVVIGIGGSYLGARAAIEMLTGTFSNLQSKEERNAPIVLFAGNNISSSYLKDLMDLVKDKELFINVISKSGTTTEPAIAFRFLKELLESKYGREEAAKRIYVTTDKEKGSLKNLAREEGYETFDIPDDVGGRFSVLTAVGLLPLAVAGIDIDSIMKGASEAYMDALNPDLSVNHCYMYAATRSALYNKGKTIEILANYEPALHYLGEWWKQLYGESEGKDGKGIFPAAVDFSTDLHSMGQYIQDGHRNIFETVLNVVNAPGDLVILKNKEDGDGLNFLQGKSLQYVNTKAFQGTLLAHNDGGVPNIIINVPTINEFYFGYLVYFFEKACGISGYMLGVNPFDQPGVEAYKKNMFALLGKPGYEQQKKELEARL